MKDKEYHRQYNLKRQEQKRIARVEKYREQVGTKKDRFLAKYDWDVSKAPLNNLERLLIARYYLLDEFSGASPVTWEDIAKFCGLSRQQCSLIHKVAIAKLDAVKVAIKST